MKPYRSILFVPGHKRSWIDKALASEADAIIIDLEDSVPEPDKALARANARDALGSHVADKGILIRPNALDTLHFGQDIAETTHRNLTGFLLPKLFSRDDVVRFDALVTAAEIQHNVPKGTVELIPSLETAASINKVDEILAGPRVGGVMAAAAKDADVSREVGFSWTAEGTETLYLRSKVVLAARAAGLRSIVLGLWQEVSNIDGLRRFAEANNGLGYTGQVLIHPTHAPVANESYGLSPAMRGYYEGLVEAFEEGQRHGHGAVSYRGDHIDLAHANHARQALAFAGQN
ncbi:citrate lyase subunit beta/citryl-CoA lyase [Paenarthrobacter nicotinovorans]|uniref:HpcH/HpaI aldolase/citrate lyase family protein n=1 Tax=Micrococcaceae TaxID=1268 RepID=UPI000876200C|nr:MULTISPECIES: CoA ester lyase [Micrococcaceae]MDR6438704.1 citrate lyase subunit beta/citryl-CoA lyase [Paenarthrobacter nicotinovorans]SCZ56512.1 citrate lyase subunit beta / citryl-CoA lyase [Arthrobacter sp. UNCCL28]